METDLIQAYKHLVELLTVKNDYSDEAIFPLKLIKKEDELRSKIAQLEQSPVIKSVSMEEYQTLYNSYGNVVRELDELFLVSDGKEVWLGYHSKNGIWSVVYDGAPLVKEDKDWQQELFNYMNKEHGLILLQDEMNQIKEIFLPTKYPHTL